ncbi:MAG TPA: hypothetical protein VJU82_09240, partial [Acidobacteriaceae bacterium]|nr:hypothetical protein [Acidobacteriaceae bacterium]
AGHVWLTVIGLINSGVACYYYLRLLASVYTSREDTELSTSAVRRATRVPAGIALALTAAATLMLGIMPGRVLHLADYASWMLQANQPAADTTAGVSTEAKSALQR